jgi:hypothetical protein
VTVARSSIQPFHQIELRLETLRRTGILQGSLNCGVGDRNSCRVRSSAFTERLDIGSLWVPLKLIGLGFVTTAIEDTPIVGQGIDGEFLSLTKQILIMPDFVDDELRESDSGNSATNYTFG